MNTNANIPPSEINTDTIATFTYDGTHLELRFKDESVLKIRASACVLACGKKLLVGKELRFPDALLIGGKPVADGRPRCKGCDVLLTDENRIDGYCWPCCQKLEGVEVAIGACRTLGVRNAAEVVHAYLKKLNPEDAAALDGETLLNEIVKKGE